MSSPLSTKPYKGSRDFFPAEMRSRDWMFSVLENKVKQFGYEKIDAPILEPLELYQAKTSEEIVNQQIYNFQDRGGRNVALRPEMTPTVSRMVAAKVRELPRPIRWYSVPNLWRYEKMGRGRLREHWQLNCDIFGAANELLADVEILQLAIELLRAFGARADQFQLYVNHRGILNEVLDNLEVPPEKHASIARILDKKEKLSFEEFEKGLREEGLSQEQIQGVLDYFEKKEEYLDTRDQEGAQHALHERLSLLRELGYGDYIRYEPSVVRGFDYYTGMVFEVFDQHPQNRRSIFGGGRYDNLVSYFVKDSLNAVGFGLGDVTLVNFLEAHKLSQEFERETQVYLAHFPGKKVQARALQLAQGLREAGFRVEVSLGQSKVAKQFQEADNKGISCVVILGEDELAENAVQVKELSSGEQQKVSQADLVEHLSQLIMSA